MGALSSTQRLKYLLKWLIAHTLYWCGILALWKRVALRGRAVVLTYHRVLPDDVARVTWSHKAIIVSRDTFERQMTLLKDEFKMMSLGDFEGHLSTRRPFETASCLVTFDDGWHDTYTEAWPVLRRHRIPAVVFLPAHFISTRDTFWQEKLGYLLHETWTRAVADPPFAERAGTVLQEWTLDGILALPATQVVDVILDRVRELKSDAGLQTTAIVAALAALLGVETSAAAPVDRFMNWQEVREMSLDSITFGGHGDTHAILTRVPPDTLEREVAGAKAAIRHQLGMDVQSFSYPNGSWDRRVASAVESASYTMAFSMDRGAVSVDDNRFTIRRINIHEDVSRSAPMFLARVLGVF